MELFTALSVLAAICVSGGVGFYLNKHLNAKRIGDATELATRIVEESRKEAQAQKKEILLQGQDELFNQKRELEHEFKERERELKARDRKLQEQGERLEEKLEKAYQTLCPITKYSGKTLAEVLTVDPHALVWVANKYKGNPEVKKHSSGSSDIDHIK